MALVLGRVVDGLRRVRGQPVNDGCVTTAVAAQPMRVTGADAVVPPLAVAVTVWAPAPTVQGTVKVPAKAPDASAVSVPSTTGFEAMLTVTLVFAG